MKVFYEATENRSEIISRIKDDVIVTIRVTIIGSNDLSIYKWYPSFFVEHYIYDVFFIVNMSLPGACEFLNLRITENGSFENDRFYLSSYAIEKAYEAVL